MLNTKISQREKKKNGQWQKWARPQIVCTWRDGCENAFWIFLVNAYRSNEFHFILLERWSIFYILSLMKVGIAYKEWDNENLTPKFAH